MRYVHVLVGYTILLKSGNIARYTITMVIIIIIAIVVVVVDFVFVFVIILTLVVAATVVVALVSKVLMLRSVTEESVGPTYCHASSY